MHVLKDKVSRTARARIVQLESTVKVEPVLIAKKEASLPVCDIISVIKIVEMSPVLHHPRFHSTSIHPENSFAVDELRPVNTVKMANISKNF